MIGGKALRVHEGDAFVIPEMTAHRMLSLEEDGFSFFETKLYIKAIFADFELYFRGVAFHRQRAGLSVVVYGVVGKAELAYRRIDGESLFGSQRALPFSANEKSGLSCGKNGFILRFFPAVLALSALSAFSAVLFFAPALALSALFAFFTLTVSAALLLASALGFVATLPPLSAIFRGV